MKADALRGHLDALVLAVLEAEELHGYAIADRLAERSSGSVEVATGTLYPALRRLEQGGLLESSWSEVGGRRRRTYRLTPAGSRALAVERDEWRALTSVVDAVLRPGEAR